MRNGCHVAHAAARLKNNTRGGVDLFRYIVLLNTCTNLMNVGRFLLPTRTAAMVTVLRQKDGGSEDNWTK